MSERGWASSAQVYRTTGLPDWQWNATGPGGITSGHAATEDEAWRNAREAQRQLDRAIVPRGQG